MAGPVGEVSVFQDVCVRGAVLQCLEAFGIENCSKRRKMGNDRRLAMENAITNMVISELLVEYSLLADKHKQATESLRSANEELIQVTQESMRDKLLIADREYESGLVASRCNEATDMFASFRNLFLTDDGSSSDESN